MNRLWLSFGAAVQLALWSVGPGSSSRVFEINSKAQWDTWTFPRDIVAIDDDGTIRPVEFDQPINAALNATRFTHKLKEGGEAQGGVWKIGSGQATADLVIDGDPRDLLAARPNRTPRRLVARNQSGSGSAGDQYPLDFSRCGRRSALARIPRLCRRRRPRAKNQDVFQFHLVGGTTKRNTATTVEYKASF